MGRNQLGGFLEPGKILPLDIREEIFKSYLSTKYSFPFTCGKAEIKALYCNTRTEPPIIQILDQLSAEISVLMQDKYHS